MVYIEPMRESPKTLVCCPWCTEGIFQDINDDTGENVSRCGNCGVEEEYTPPAASMGFLGGQGNTPESVIETGMSYGIIVLVSFVSLVVGMIFGSILS